MSALSKRQREFAAALLDPRAPPPAWIRAGGASPEARLAVYRSNVFANYRGALADVYPVIARLVGEDFFVHACDRFIRDRPSTSGDLHAYGEGFDAFLGSFAPASGLPYLVDVARLEWAWHEVFHAADPVAIDFSRLTRLPPERQAQVRLRPCAALRLLESAYPVSRIWEVNQLSFSGDGSVDLDAGGEQLLVSRRADDSIEIRRLPPAHFAFVCACAAGAQLGEAVALAVAADPEVDAAAMVSGLATLGVLGAIEVPGR